MLAFITVVINRKVINFLNYLNQLLIKYFNKTISGPYPKVFDASPSALSQGFTGMIFQKGPFSSSILKKGIRKLDLWVNDNLYLSGPKSTRGILF